MFTSGSPTSIPPFVVHPDFKGKSKAGIYSDTKLEVDHNIGQILDAIKAAGSADNKIVILTGANGAGNITSPGIVTMEGAGSKGPWGGGLSTAYEGGMRTTAMIRWPGKIAAGGLSDEIVADLDIYPTVANLVGEMKRIPTDRPIGGVDQSRFLLGKQEKSNREFFDTYVTMDQYKFLLCHRYGRDRPERGQGRQVGLCRS